MGCNMKFFSIALFVAFLISLVIIIFFSVNEINIFYTTILGVSSFLLGIFIAFSISDRHKRIDELRENDSIERAELISLHNFAETFGKEKLKEIKNSIDEYLMATMDYIIWDYYRTEPDFKKIVNAVGSIEPKNDKQIQVFSKMLDIINTIAIARNKTIGILQDRLSKFEWSIFILLSTLIIVPLLFINMGSILSKTMVGILLLSIFLMLNFLNSLDNLSWKEESRIFEPYQQTFEAIGLMRYYPDALIVQKRAKNYSKYSYRMGVSPRPYPDISGRKIEIIQKQK